jgi:hypothetical protein
MTFEQAFATYGPDVERIHDETGIPAHDVDRRINAAMTAAYLERAPAAIPAPVITVPAPIVTKKLIRYAGYDERDFA